MTIVKITVCYSGENIETMKYVEIIISVIKDFSSEGIYPVNQKHNREDEDKRLLLNPYPSPPQKKKMWKNEELIH